MTTRPPNPVVLPVMFPMAERWETELAGLDFDLAITLSGVAITAWLFVIGIAIFRPPEQPDISPCTAPLAEASRR
jgi:hypothetical protein